MILIGTQEQIEAAQESKVSVETKDADRMIRRLKSQVRVLSTRAIRLRCEHGVVESLRKSRMRQLEQALGLESYCSMARGYAWEDEWWVRVIARTLGTGEPPHVETRPLPDWLRVSERSYTRALRAELSAVEQDVDMKERELEGALSRLQTERDAHAAFKRRVCELVGAPCLASDRETLEAIERETQEERMRRYREEP